jgi:hypothetical protein
MANIIKGIHTLNDVSENVLKKMEQAALILQQHYSLTFKILDYNAKEVTIRVVQERNPKDGIFAPKELIDTTHETFDVFFPDKRVLVRAISYKESPVEIVDANWIEKKMLDTNIKLKDIAEDTGLNKTYLSNLINENKTLSQAMKAMFFFYFSVKEDGKL